VVSLQEKTIFVVVAVLLVTDRHTHRDSIYHASTLQLCILKTSNMLLMK